MEAAMKNQQQKSNTEHRVVESQSEQRKNQIE
jgi:hypothetical protein